MEMGKVETIIRETAEKDGITFFGLIDPLQEVETSLEYATAFEEGGADVILIGGSLGVSETLVDKVVKRIKEKLSLPVMLFPGNINGVSTEADALYFMSLMNSQNPYWITGAQALAAPNIVKSGIEAIPTSLLIVEPGEAVGWVGEARPLLTHKPDLATAYAVAGKLLGHRMTILERGSGAPGPAPPEMFTQVREAVGHPVICAGSCKNLKQIEQTVKAGADGIHIASQIENSDYPEKKAERIIRATKEAGRQKLKRR